MTASQRKPQAGGIEHGPLVRIMPWEQAVRWQLPVLMAQAQIRSAKHRTTCCWARASRTSHIVVDMPTA